MPSRMLVRCLCFLLLTLSTSAGQERYRLLDEEAVRWTDGSFPRGVVGHRGQVYFTAAPGLNHTHRSLWVTGDGVEDFARQVTDQQSVSDYKVSCGEALYYWAEDALWGLRNNSTEKIYDWSGLSDEPPRPEDRTVGCDQASGRLLFVVAERFGDKAALWQSEGTSATTGELLDFSEAMSQARLLCVESMTLLMASNWGSQVGLWRLDALTGALDLLVIGERLGFGAVAGGRLIFHRADGHADHTLNAYAFDTGEEVELVRMSPGSWDSFESFHVVGTTCYFTTPTAALDGTSRDLWLTDGTPTGTKRLTDNWTSGIRTDIMGRAGAILVVRDWQKSDGSVTHYDVVGETLQPVSWDVPQISQSVPGHSAGVAHLLFKGSSSEFADMTVFVRSDGERTSAWLKPGLILDTDPRLDGQVPFAEVNERVWFAGSLSTHVVYGTEVFSVGLNDGGSVRLSRDVYAFPRGGHDYMARVAGDALVYMGFPSQDYTAVGIYRSGGEVEQFRAEYPGAYPRYAAITDNGRHFYFAGWNSLQHIDLTNGEATVLVENDTSIAPKGVQGEFGFVTLGDRVFYLRGFSSLDLWSTTGQPNSTVRVLTNVTKNENPFRVGDKVYAARMDGTRSEIWETDGTVEGTRLVYREPDDNLQLLIKDGHEELLMVEVKGTGIHGFKLIDVTTGVALSAEVPAGMRRIQGHELTLDHGVILDAYAENEDSLSLWFMAFDDPVPRRLEWEPASAHSSLAWPQQAVRLSDGAVFAAQTEEGMELWRLQDTTLTKLTHFRIEGNGGVTSSEVAKIGSIVYFSADDGVHGDELHGLDLTTGRTFLAADLRAGSLSSYPRDFHVLGEELLFWAASDVSPALALHAFTPGSVVSNGESLEWIGGADSLSLSLRAFEDASAQLYESADLEAWQPVPGAVVPAAETSVIAVPGGPRQQAYYRLGPTSN